MKKILFIILMATCTISISAQKKNVIIDVSHDVDTIYTYVNPNIFNLPVGGINSLKNVRK